MNLAPSVVKRCATCGRSYTLSAWACLRLCGYLCEVKDVAGEVLEVRACECGSSISMDMGDEPDSLGWMPVARLSERT